MHPPDLQRLTSAQYEQLAEAGVFHKVELLDGVVRTGTFRFAYSPAQRAVAEKLGIELPPNETVEEHAAFWAQFPDE